jgi:hypothetical protein
MEIPSITHGARLPTLALMVSMALAGAVAAADDGVAATPAQRVTPPGIKLRRRGSIPIRAGLTVAGSGRSRSQGLVGPQG